MKILYLNLFDDPAEGGGTEVTLRNLTQGILTAGHEVVMLSTGPQTGLQSIKRNDIRIWRAGLRNIYWPDLRQQPPAAARALWHLLDSYNLAMQPLLRQVLRAERPDVVSIHNLPGWSAAAWRTIAREGIPMVQVLHDSYAICARSSMYHEGRGNCAGQCTGCRLLRLPHRTLSRKVSAVVGVSRYILDRHLQEGYFADVPIQRVIHNARDPRQLGVLDAPLRTPGGALRFGYMGRLEAAKGIAPLLEAFAAAQLPQAELWVAGNGKPEVVEPLRQRYAHAPVRFLGRVAPRDFYPHIDVMVVPSLWNDTFPGVVFEALAFGKPVIGSRRGGIPEMVRPGENGLLFEPDTPGKLSSALRQLAADPALRARMGMAAGESAREFLDVRGWVGRYLQIFEDVVSGSSDVCVNARPNPQSHF